MITAPFKNKLSGFINSTGVVSIILLGEAKSNILTKSDNRHKNEVLHEFFRSDNIITLMDKTLVLVVCSSGQTLLLLYRLLCKFTTPQ